MIDGLSKSSNPTLTVASARVQTTDGWAILWLSNSRAYDSTDLILRNIRLISHGALTYQGSFNGFQQNYTNKNHKKYLKVIDQGKWFIFLANLTEAQVGRESRKWETNCSKYNTTNQVIQIDEILIRMRNENGSSKIYQLW